MKDIVSSPPPIVRNDVAAVQALFQKNVVPSYGRFDIALSHGSGSYIYDVTGKRYLDFGGGIAVTALGHAHAAITEALIEQSRKLVHVSNLYYTEPQGRLAEAIVKNEACILRENSGTSGIVESARTAVATLADHDIPHLIVGGLAVQEHGYPRVTIDVDIVVPDVIEAVEFLTASLTGPFYRVPNVHDRIEDRRNGVMIDLLPAGRILKAGCKVPFPEPHAVAEQLQIAKLQDLISLKLDSWSGTPVRRHKDKTDVIELIIRRKLPRDFPVAPAVGKLYTDTWDALQAES